jgi:hypothetical protein
VQAQAVTSQSSFYSSNDKRLHFGLGSAIAADIDIFWPSGNVQSLKNEPANRLITVIEEKGVVSREEFTPKTSQV